MPAELLAIGAALLLATSFLASDRFGPRSTVWALLVVVASVALLLAHKDALRQAGVAREALYAEVPHLQRDGGYVSSSTCRACHPGEHATWHQSYHRTMTQVATPAAVMAPFDDVTLEAGGRTYVLSREGDAFYVDMIDPKWERDQTRARKGTPPETAGAPRRKARVVMSTGSHYMQTFWVEAPGTREVFSLPWIYDFESQRWLPRESVFLRDPAAGRFTQIWNDNCSQCHSTGPQPRLTREGADTRVGELGIACEACHGPGAEHVEANRSLLRRYARHLGLADAPDETIVNPARLSPRASAQVCGQCHSKSAIATPNEWYTGDGLPYRPGGELTDSRAPILPRSQPDHPALLWGLKNDPAYVEQFFWRDGMIRVSGREYNGMVESKCHTAGELACTSCHQLHGDDPDMQLGPEMRGPAACQRCHEELVGEAITAHTHHAAGSPGSDCLNCHMPYTSYGLMRGLRSHLIDAPSVAPTIEVGRPNACNICHLDRPLAWADAKLTEWYGHPSQAARLGDEDRQVAASVQWILRGDAGQRALAAWYMGWEPARQASGTDWMAPHLIEVLSDPYDVVRFIAARTLRTLPGFEGLAYDFIAPPTAREAAQQEARGRFPGAAPALAVLIGPDRQPDRAAITNLLKARDDRVVDLRE